MSKITVTTIAGVTSGSDANKVKIESGDDLVVESGGIGIGTSTVSTAIGGGIEIHRANGSSFRIEDTTNSVVGELQVYSNGVNLVAQTNHPIIVSPNNAEIARFTTAGLHLGGTGAANALDDYEEGTWTPSVGGSATYTTQAGYYKKIGNMVFITGILVINNISGAAHTNYLDGLPFGSVTGNGREGFVGVQYFGNLASTGTFFCLRTNGDRLYGSAQRENDNTMAVNVDIFQNSTEVSFGGAYFVT